MADILVIDDNRVLCSSLRAVLEAGGHHVREAQDGAAGLELQRQQAAELVFCDLFMPGQEGLETIQILRRLYPSVKVVAMSGGGLGGKLNLLEVAVKLGASHALAKPFQAEDALAAVASILQGDGKG